MTGTYGQSHPLAEPGDTVACERPQCGARFIDTPDGRHAHRVVFGHEPRYTYPARAGFRPEVTA
jgi:hypothetical protein